MLLNGKMQHIKKPLFCTRLKFIHIFVLCSLLTANLAAALEIKFFENKIERKLSQDSQKLFKQILPEADSLDLRIEKMDEVKTAFMTVLLDQKNEDGFLIVKKIPNINSHTYLVAWMLQGHFYFLKDRATSDRHKRHLQLLSRYFDGRTLYGGDTFYQGETVQLYYKPLLAKVRGMKFNISASNRVLYSGSSGQTGFAKILVPGFKHKYIAILPKNQ